MIDNNYNIRLIDFGLSENVDITSNLDSTHHYRPPEILEELPKIRNSKVDIWCLGVILFSLLFNYFPFTGNLYDKAFYLIKNNLYDEFWEFHTELKISDKLKLIFNKIFTYDFIKRIHIRKLNKEITNILTEKWYK